MGRRVTPYSVGRCPKDRGYGHPLGAPSPTIYNNKFFSYAIADCRLVQSECVYARKREQGAASRCGTAGALIEIALCSEEFSEENSTAGSSS